MVDPLKEPINLIFHLPLWLRRLRGVRILIFFLTPQFLFSFIDFLQALLHLLLQILEPIFLTFVDFYLFLLLEFEQIVVIDGPSRVSHNVTVLKLRAFIY